MPEVFGQTKTVKNNGRTTKKMIPAVRLYRVISLKSINPNKIRTHINQEYQGMASNKNMIISSFQGFDL
jgi:hypothetical protein